MWSLNLVRLKIGFYIDNIPLQGFATVTSHPLPPVHFLRAICVRMVCGAIS